jgi:GntR family transcriptional repressor for pyruvate dehydrogenase complex
MSEKPISKSIVEDITATLRNEILRGQYRPGERLPSERELAVRFEANRGAIRESLKKLEQLGIASINPGGVRVIPLEDASLSILGPLLDLHEEPDLELAIHLFEVLGSLMSMSARTAVERANNEEIQELLTISTNMIDAQKSDADNQENWKCIGSAFARLNNNLVLRLIFNGLRAQFLARSEQKPSFDHLVDQEKRMTILTQLHFGIESRNPTLVENAINDNFQLLIQTLENQMPNSSRSTINE